MLFVALPMQAEAFNCMSWFYSQRASQPSQLQLQWQQWIDDTGTPIDLDSFLHPQLKRKLKVSTKTLSKAFSLGSHSQKMWLRNYRLHVRTIVKDIRSQHWRMGPAEFSIAFQERFLLLDYATYRMMQLTEERTGVAPRLSSRDTSWRDTREFLSLIYYPFIPFFESATYYHRLHKKGYDNFAKLIDDPPFLDFHLRAQAAPRLYSPLFVEWIVKKYRWLYYVPVILVGGVVNNIEHTFHIVEKYESLVKEFDLGDKINALIMEEEQRRIESGEVDEDIIDHYLPQIEALEKRIELEGDPDGSLSKKRDRLRQKMLTLQ
jgi:hypothetical protein